MGRGQRWACYSLTLVTAGVALLGPGASGASVTGPDAGPLAASGVSDRKPRVTFVFGAMSTEATSLVVGGAVDTGGLETTYHVEYGTGGYGSRTQSKTLPATPRPGSGYPNVGDVSAVLSGLRPAVRYQYRLVASNSLGSIASQGRTIVTGGKSPRISDVYVRVTSRSTVMTLGATFDTGGLPTVARTECSGGARPTPEIRLPAVPSPRSWASTKREVRLSIGGLAPGKRYLCRLVASNDVGATAYERDFVAAKKPRGVQYPAVGVGPVSTSVVLTAMVDTAGLETTYYVDYGTSPRYGSQTPKRKLAARPGKGWSPTTTEIRVPLRDLKPASTYYFRIVSVNTARTDSVARSFVSDGSRPLFGHLYAGPAAGFYSVIFTAGVGTGGLPTSYYVEYGPTLAYGQRTGTRALPAVPSPGSYRSTYTDAGTEELVLDRGATIHYRFVATNAAGVTRSSDRTYAVR